MAVRISVFTTADERNPVIAWGKTVALANGDTGEPVQFAKYYDWSVQAVGTFGAAGSVAIEGSNDGGVTFAPLNNRQGTAIALTTNAVVAVQEMPNLVRPRVTAGDGTTALVIYISGAIRSF